jgi:hypothetical protein
LYKEEQVPITWEAFERELLIRFSPTEVEDYNEALSKIQQEGTLWDYQQEFERFANRVARWPQKALVGTFIGGLKQDIISTMRMFKSKTLCDAIELARMRDDNLSRDWKTASGEGPTVSIYQSGTQQMLHAHIHRVRPRNCCGRRCRKEGRKAYVSAAMKSSHQNIVAKHLKHSLLSREKV